MDTYTPGQREEGWDAADQHASEPHSDGPLPRRARRQFFNRRTAALGALVTCALGFYAGIRVEKSQLSSSTAVLGSSGGTGARAAAFAALAARGGATRSGATRSGAAASGATGSGATGSGANGAAGGGGFTGGGGLGGAGGANASFGTVAGVKGKTILVTDTSGNTVKVKLTASTRITKNQSVSRHAIRPGDTVVVTGAAGSGGSTNAATITDSGNRGGSGSGGSSSGSSSGSGSGSGAGGNSPVGSLFSPGG